MGENTDDAGADADITSTEPPAAGGVGVEVADTAAIPPRDEPRRPPFGLRVAAPAAAAVIAAGVGLWGLTAGSISNDEAATIDIGSRTLPQIFHMLHNYDVVHGLYYLTMHFWMILFGPTPAAVRAPSLIAAVLGALMMVELGTRLVSLRAGFIAGVLYACAPMISMYAHDARSYAIDSLFVITATYLFVRALTGGGRWAWVGYGTVVVVMVGLHVFTILILPAHAVTAAWHARRGRDWRAVRWWTVTVAVAFIALTPLFVLTLRQSGLADYTPRPSWQYVKQFLFDTSGSYISGGHTSGGPWLAVPMFGLAALAVRCAPRNPATPSVAQVGLPWLALPPLLLFGYSLHHPLYQYRYLLYCVPALVLLVAATLDKLRWHLGIPVALALIAAFIPTQLTVRNTSLDPSDAKGEAAVIAAQKRPGDAILFLLPNQRRFINSYPSAYAGLNDVLMDQSQAVTGTFEGTNVDDATLMDRLRHVDRLWAVRYFDWWDRRFVDADLAKVRDAEIKAAGLRWVSSAHFRGRGVIYLYVRPGTG